MERRVVTPRPPRPFDPLIATMSAGSPLYRVYSPPRHATEFNPGVGAPTRFAFFGTPRVPVLYAAGSEEAAIAETLLHDIPPQGGPLPYDRYASKVMCRITVTRTLRLAVLHGLGLRRLGVTAEQVTASPADTYEHTVRWAEAAHDFTDADGLLDGLVWMSRLCNDARAYLFFGDRCADAFETDESSARLLATGIDQMWLIDLCAPLHVDVLLAD